MFSMYLGENRRWVPLTAGLYVVTEQKEEFFHSLLFCSKADFRSANLTSEVIFFNEIVKVATSKSACELTE